MTDQNELDRQVQESYKRIQQQNTGVAREYAEGSIETLRQQVEDTRNTLEQLTGQLPEGDLHPFRMVVQEMLDAFTWVTDALDNVEETISGLDITQYMEDNAQDAGQEEASDEEDDAEEEPAEATGEAESEAAGDEDENAEEESGGEEESEESEELEEVRATAAARRKAEELEVDLSGLEGTGLNGIITVSDVTGNGG